MRLAIVVVLLAVMSVSADTRRHHHRHRHHHSKALEAADSKPVPHIDIHAASPHAAAAAPHASKPTDWAAFAKAFDEQLRFPDVASSTGDAGAPTLTATPTVATVGSSSGANLPNPAGLSSLDLPQFQPVNPNDIPLQQNPVAQPQLLTPQQTQVNAYLSQTQSVLTRLQTQLDQQTAWATTVRDVIQNYSFKYGQVLDDMKSRQSKVNKLKDLLKQLQKAQTHTALVADVQRMTTALSNLGDGSESYKGIREKLEQSQAEIQKLGGANVDEVLKDIGLKLSDALADPTPPKSTEVPPPAPSASVPTPAPSTNTDTPAALPPVPTPPPLPKFF